MDFTIRKATEQDSAAISTLIRSVANLYVQEDFLTDIGKVKFFNSTSQNSIADYLKDGYLYWLAECERETRGVIAIKENKHIFHLFVHPKFHGKGIASALWDRAFQHALQKGNPGNFTVFSSSFAHNLYKKWGFRDTKAFMIKNGIRSIPMSLEVGQSTSI